ncbi:MAG: hypothetical protein GF350_12730, partial [Chitinivibrionales bacterium]|nr:hypothetical protein [Chitinivibrionales bacterium]
ADKESILYKMQSANYYSSTGNFTKALKVYDEILSENNDMPFVLMKKAELLSWMKKLNESIKFYTEIIENDNALRVARTSARVKRAEIMAWLGDIDKAMEEVNAVINENPSHADAYTLRGQLHEWRNNSENAKEDFDRADNLRKKSSVKPRKLRRYQKSN